MHASSIFTFSSSTLPAPLLEPFGDQIEARNLYYTLLGVPVVPFWGSKVEVHFWDPLPDPMSRGGFARGVPRVTRVPQSPPAPSLEQPEHRKREGILSMESYEGKYRNTRRYPAKAVSAHLI